LLAELGIRAQRSALPGVQDKVSAAMINLPVARAGERYILKLNPQGFPHLVENESFFLTCARRSGLTTTPSNLVFDADGRPGLLVQRFDRVTVAGALRALAVEDGCQVMNRPPADKYLIGTDRTFAGLAAICDAVAFAGRELVRQLAFAYLTGNGDAHAKNFSVLRGLDGEWRVSPAYDVPNSTLYGDTTMAMSIGGRMGGDFGAADFVELGRSLQVPSRATHAVLQELADRVDQWLPDLDSLPFNAGKLNKLRRVIRYRQSRLGPS
jgi:serine/threonine-protein kinase HipA